jgi:hypothetical protein
MAETVDSAASDADREWLADVVARANGGDQEALAELRRFLDTNTELARKLGDVAWHAESALTELISGGDALAAEAIRRESDRLRDELRGDQASPLEKLLVDNVVASHLHLRNLQLLAARSPGSTKGQTTLLAKRLEGAQRLHAGAIKSLVTVRKLLPAGKPAAPLRVFAAGGQGG